MLYSWESQSPSKPKAKLLGVAQKKLELIGKAKNVIKIRVEDL